MHAFLYFRKQIWVQARRSLHEQPDIPRQTDVEVCSSPGVVVPVHLLEHVCHWNYQYRSLADVRNPQ